MKKYLQHIHSKVNFWNLFIGIIIGFGIGIWVINALVPDANHLIRMYHLDRKSQDEEQAMRKHHGISDTNQYMSGSITTEKQFIEEMIEHHKAAVVMAQQVLALSPRSEIIKLANDIISAQSTEIKMMQDWLAAWK
jgi:uncharacterized protein (DUF305 family)